MLRGTKWTVPDGVRLTIQAPGKDFNDGIALALEQQDWAGIGRIMQLPDDHPYIRQLQGQLDGVATHLPGAEMPILLIDSPDGLTIMSNSRTVDRWRIGAEVIHAGDGDVIWAACKLL